MIASHQAYVAHSALSISFHFVGETAGVKDRLVLCSCVSLWEWQLVPS